MPALGRTPYLSAQEFQEIGYRIVIFPVTALRVALAFIFQAQSGAWMIKLDRRWGILSSPARAAAFARPGDSRLS